MVQLVEAIAKVKELNQKVPGCDVCENGKTQRNHGEHTTVCKETERSSGVADSMWSVRIDSTGKHLQETLPETPAAKRQQNEEAVAIMPEPSSPAVASSSAAAASPAPDVRRKITSKRPPAEETAEGEPPKKVERGQTDMDCMQILQVMVESAREYTTKALQEVNEKLHHEKTMVLKGVEPQTQAEARAKEIDKITKQETYEEVYLEAGMKMISGKWVDTEKTPGVAKARWVL